MLTRNFWVFKSFYLIDSKLLKFPNNNFHLQKGGICLSLLCMYIILSSIFLSFQNRNVIFTWYMQELRWTRFHLTGRAGWGDLSSHTRGHIHTCTVIMIFNNPCRIYVDIMTGKNCPQFAISPWKGMGDLITLQLPLLENM